MTMRNEIILFVPFYQLTAVFYMHFSLLCCVLCCLGNLKKTWKLSNMDTIKLIIVGPAGTGKTSISNFLADATELSYDYRPTKGVRILEFDVSNVNVRNKHVKIDVELWDCSGDSRFESCWPALRRDTQGVIFVYNKDSSEHVKELEKLYDYFVNQAKLEPKNCVVFYFAGEKIHLDTPRRISNTFAKISQVNCNIEDDGNKLKSDFQTFLGTLMTRMEDKKEQEENIILKDNGILFR